MSVYETIEKIFTHNKDKVYGVEEERSKRWHWKEGKSYSNLFINAHQSTAVTKGHSQNFNTFCEWYFRHAENTLNVLTLF